MGRYALIIGTDEYADPKLAQLKTPTADARAMAEALADENLGEFDEVLQCINKNEYEVRRVIAEFLDDKKPDDLVLIYFSGHGVQDSTGHLHLALKDTKSRFVSATAMPSFFVTQQMDNCRSKKQVLILDCCHSGAFALGGLKSGEEKAVTKATFEGEGVGRVVLTASDATQFALEGDQALEQTEFSLFTHFLLDGLKTGKADQDNDGFVSLDEWYEYTYYQVRSVTPRQFPQKWSYRQQGDLRIAKNPHYKKKATELPADLLTLLDSYYSDVRVGAVRELGKLLRSRDRELADLAHATLEGLVKDDSDKVKNAVGEELKGLAHTQSQPQVSPRIDPGAQEKPKTAATKIDKKPVEEKKPVLETPKPVPIASPPNKIIISNGMELLRVPAGKFLMGSKPDNKQAFDDEKPQHTVDIPYNYWMARFPVTNELYNAYVEAKGINHPMAGWEKKKDHPVTDVKWTDAMEYCSWLNNLLKAELPSGLVLRLPTEAEWEKAARWKPSPSGRGQGVVLSLSKDEGESLEYPWGNEFDKNKCNSSEGSKRGTTSVGLYSPQGDSPYGCVDMAGNVWEWTYSLKKGYPYKFDDGREDEKASGARVRRGGSFDDNEGGARCACRDDYLIYFLNVNLGFRVAASSA